MVLQIKEIIVLYVVNISQVNLSIPCTTLYDIIQHSIRNSINETVAEKSTSFELKCNLFFIGSRLVALLEG